MPDMAPILPAIILEWDRVGGQVDELPDGLIIHHSILGNVGSDLVYLLNESIQNVEYGNPGKMMIEAGRS